MIPRISVVISAYNAQPTVGEAVRAVMNQPLPPGSFECIVVDDGSTDGTGEAARAAGATVLRLPQNRGIAGARNAGIGAARGDWIAFTDADCVPSRRWLTSILAETDMADASLLAIAGKTLGLDSRTPAARFVDLIGALDAETYLRHETMPWAPGGNVAYRREHLLAVDGFDSSFRTYETADLHLRMTARFGGRTVYLPAAIVLHRHRASWGAMWKQQRNYGVGYAQFLLKHANRWPWSVTSEFCAWRLIASCAARACFTRGDRGLVCRGLFVKQLAQRIGFVSEYFSLHRRLPVSRAGLPPPIMDAPRNHQPAAAGEAPEMAERPPAVPSPLPSDGRGEGQDEVSPHAKEVGRARHSVRADIHGEAPVHGKPA